MTIFVKCFTCVRRILGSAFLFQRLILGEQMLRVEVLFVLKLCIIFLYCGFRCRLVKEHNVNIPNLIKVLRIRERESLHLWEASGGAVRPNSALTASTTRLWRVFRRTSSHMSNGGSVLGSSAVPSWSTMLRCCRCSLILPPSTVSLWVVGCKDMGEGDKVRSWCWQGSNFKAEGASCCMIVGSVSMFLKRDRRRKIHNWTHVTKGGKKVDFRAGCCWQHYQNKEVSTSMTMSLSGPCVRQGRASARDSFDTVAPGFWDFKDLFLRQHSAML